MSNQQYEARDVQRILGINRNKLFYWTHSHRLLVPEVAEAAGTGRRARFSMKNLVELAFIQNVVDFGVDLRSIKTIKEVLDKGEVFDEALKTPFQEEYHVLLYRLSGTEFVVKVEGVFDGVEADYDKDGGATPAPGPDEFFLNYEGDESALHKYVSFRIDLGRIAMDVVTKASGA